MTVKRLIELLQILPQDLPVYLSDWSQGYEPDTPIDEQLMPRVVEACAQSPKRVAFG